MTRIPAHARPTTLPATRRGGRVRGRADAGRNSRIAVAARPRSAVARVARVGVGSAVAAAVMVCGLSLTFSARRLTEPAAVARPDLLEVGLRCGGLALMAAAQVVVRSAVVGAVYPLRRGDWTFELVAWAVMLVAAVGAVVSGLSGW